MSFGDATFDQILLDAHKLHVAIKITDELLYDNAFNLESYIIDQFAKALSNAEEDAFLNGDGVGKPLGIFAETGGGQVAVTTNTQSSITGDELINLVYALKRPYRKNAKFIMNDQTIALLRKLKDNNGAYLWQPAVQAGEPDRLYGYPVYTSEYVPTVVTANLSLPLVISATITSVTVVCVHSTNFVNSLRAMVWLASLPKNVWMGNSSYLKLFKS